ncbi:MAG: MFS transporter, partial [Alicyclobacillaceae bacterium]|nr:MFS transporter [Alicyclobacillaceae bacterium]
MSKEGASRITHAAKPSSYPVESVKSPVLQMAVLILGAFMALLDTSVVNVAIPRMEVALHATTEQIQWVVTAYMLVLGMLVPISGWLTDRYGPKRLFLSALFLFTTGSALCGAAWNLPAMIGFRILQAIGGGLMQPVSMTMTYRIFPPERRGTVNGFVGIAIMMAPAFGPALSGYLVDHGSW